MLPGMGEPDLDRLLRERGGLEGLARELGQYGRPSAFKPSANENEPEQSLGLLRRLLDKVRFLARFGFRHPK